MGMKKEKVVNEDDIDNDSMRRVQNSSSSIVSREDNRHVHSVSRNLHTLQIVLLKLVSGVIKKGEWWRYPGQRKKESQMQFIHPLGSN